ncbi:MAG: glycosyltransferase [Parasporobacterium sp.]|nr:glycosyltransferase [Parasporobacterium sp.]
MDRPVVSVIIPVYNVKEYIRKAAESICAQTLTDWEMLLVDDGSIDGSSQVCDELASEDDRIRVIHQENRGAAEARNAAIEQASGKYLYFMDADDWTAEGMLYDMVCLAENYEFDAWAGVPVDNSGRNLENIGRYTYKPNEMKADVPDERCAQMVISAFYIETYYSDMDYYIQKQACIPKVFASKGEFRRMAHELFDKNLLYTPWNKLYLASYIKENNIRFPSVHWDDFPFNLEVIRHIERVSVTDKAYYHFLRKRTDSESEKYNPSLYEKREEENKWLIDLYDGWKCEVQQQLIAYMKENPEQITTSADPKNTPEGSESQLSEEKTSEAPKGENVSEAVTLNEQGAVSFNFLDSKAASVPVVDIPSAEADEFISRRYLERIVGCVENITNPECTLTKDEKIKEIKRIISQDSVRQALKSAKPRSAYMKSMLMPVRIKSAKLTYAEGAFISKMKAKHMKQFASLKANR